MFRIGSALFIPAYLTVILYRPFASATSDGGGALMAGEPIALHRDPVFTHHISISSFVQHVSFLNPYVDLANCGHADPVR